MSRHLRVLREAGLVRVRKEGRQRVYTLRSEGIAQLDAWISKYRGYWETELDALEAHLNVGRDASRRPPSRRAVP